MNTPSNPITEQMQQHCSVRRFRDEAIAPELLHQLLASGQAAASSSFVQAYSVIRVSKPEHRQQIAEAAGGQAWIEQAPEFLVMCADLLRIEHCCEQMDMGKLEGYTEHLITATVDVALMAQNVMLAAESHGLGGVFIGGIRNQPALISELLNLPEQVYPVFGLCLGYPLKAGQAKPRLPVSAILHEGQYQAERIAEDVQTYDAQMSAYYAQRSSNQRNSDWSTQTAKAIQGKRREHMLVFLQARGFLKC